MLIERIDYLTNAMNSPMNAINSRINVTNEMIEARCHEIADEY